MNCNTSDIYIGSTVLSSVYTLTCTNGTFNGGDGEHWIGCIKVNSGGICNLTSGITHINGEESTSSASVLLGTGGASTNLVHNGGTVSFETNRSNQIILQYVDITLNNVIVDLGNITDRLNQWANGSITTLNILGTLEIKKGKFDTKYESVQECNLTVSGTTTVGNASATGVDYAELVTNESVIDLRGVNNTTPGLKMLAGGTYNGVANANQSIGSVNAQTTTYNSKIYLTSGTTTIYQEDTGNHAWSTYGTGDVTIYHGNGTVEFTAGTYVYVYNNVNAFYNMVVNHTGAPGNRVALSGDVEVNIDNDLTVTDGDFFAGGAAQLNVGNDCFVNNGATHTFTADGDVAFTVLGEFTVGLSGNYVGGTGDNIFGVISMSGNSTMTATSGITYLTGSAGSTNQEGATWTPFYQKAGAIFNHNNGTFHNKNTQGYIGYGPGGWGPFYNYIQDLTENGSHTLNTNLICENDLTISGTATLYGGVWGLRNESGYAMHASGNLTLLAGAGMGGLAYNNDTDMITRGNIIMHTGSILQTATGSTAPYWTVGGGLFNNGGTIL